MTLHNSILICLLTLTTALAAADQKPKHFFGEVARFGPQTSSAGQSLGAVSQDGKRAITRAKGLSVWNLAEKKFKTIKQPNHTAAVAMSADGKIAAAVILNSKTELQVYDAETGSPKKTITLEKSARIEREGGVALNKDGSRAAIASRESVIVLDTSSGKATQTFTGLPRKTEVQAFSPDGKLVYARDSSAGHLLSLSTGKTLRRIPFERRDYSTWATFSPDSKQLFVGSANGLACIATKDGKKLYAAASGKYDVRSAAKSRKGKQLLLGTSSGKVLFVDTETQAITLTMVIGRSPVTALGWTSDGIWAFQPETGVQILEGFDLLNATLLDTDPRGGGPLISLAFNTRGDRLLAGYDEDDIARSWRIKDGLVVQRWKMGARSVPHIAVAPRDRFVAIGSRGSGAKITVRDYKTDKELFELRGVSPGVAGLAVSPTGKFVVAADFNRNLHFYDVTEPGETSEPKTLNGAWNKLFNPTFDPTGRRIYAFDDKQQMHMFDAAKWSYVGSKHIDHPNGCASVVASRKAKALVTAGFDGGVRVWSFSMSPKGGFETGYKMNGAAVSPSGKLIATAGEGRASVWTFKGVERARFVHPDPKRTFRCVVFSPNGRTIALGDDRGEIYLFDAPTR